MSKTVHYSILISGRVQGVGYRYFVQEIAQRLAIQGWVRNLHDGRVEADVEGIEENVERLLDQLKQGPQFSHVSKLEKTHLDTLANHIGFRITRNA